MRILFLINDINYFVSHRLDLALSFKEKGDSFSGKLSGIRGQYLMLENGVFNVRAHHGHRVDLEIR